MQHNSFFETLHPFRLFFMVTLPGVISMLMSSLYQMIDGMCVGQILGADAFAAINLVMPLVIVNFSLSDLIAVGSSVPIATKLGEKDNKSACSIFTCSCIMIVVSGALLGVTFFAFAENFLRMMGADEALVVPAAEYLKVVAVFSPVTTAMFAVDNYLRICGKVKYSMFLNILMSVLCIVLEVFFLGVLHFGMWAAALSFSLSMFVCVIVGFIPFFTGRQILKFVKPHFTSSLFVQVFSNGMPAFLFNIAGRISSVIMNVFLLNLGGATAVAAYGVILYADGIVQPVLYGFCDSLQPAVSYNYGAKRFDRVKALEKICFVACALISAVMAGVMILFSTPLARLFMSESDGVEVIDMASYAMKFFAAAYFIRWFCLTVQSYMTAVGRVAYATIISLCASLIFPVLFIYMFDKALRLDGLWLNMLFSSIATAIVSGIILVRFTLSEKKKAL